MNELISHNSLLDNLSYDPYTGLFRWKADRSGGVKAGKIAGSKDSNGYILISVLGKRYHAHRLAWFYIHGEWPINQIDHINHIRDDNRLENLRETDFKTNNLNKSIHSRNKFGIFGISWCKTHKHYCAYIGGNEQRVCLGNYKDFFEACCARKSAEMKYGYHENHGS